MGGFDPTVFSRFEHDGWQRKARGYHEMFSLLSGYLVERLLDAVEARDGKRLLDIGSGPGYVAAAAHRRGCDAVGVDFASSMVELARSLHPTCRFEVGDAQDLPFPDTSFDCVTGNFVLHHLPRQELALREMRRVLTPGGRVALTAWASPDRNRFLGLFTDAVQESGAAIPPDLAVGPPMTTSDEAYRAQLDAAGFDELFIEHVEWSHRFASAEALWSGLLAASVRTAALIEKQPARLRHAIHREFERQIASYRADDGLSVPVAVTLFGGQVPAP